MANNGFSQYLMDALLNEVFRGTGYTSPVALYVSLHSANPGVDGSNEISGNAYARVASTFSAVEANGAAGRKVANAASVLFAKATPAGWGEITHFGVWDALTVGNCLASGKLTTAVTVAANEKPEFEAGAFYIGLEQKAEA